MIYIGYVRVTVYEEKIMWNVFERLGCALGPAVVVLTPAQRETIEWACVFAERVYLEDQGDGLSYKIDDGRKPRRVLAVTSLDFSGLAGNLKPSALQAPQRFRVEFADGHCVEVKLDNTASAGQVKLVPSEVTIIDRVLLMEDSFELTNGKLGGSALTLQGRQLADALSKLAPFAPKSGEPIVLPVTVQG
jgi:hypothetical protein